MHTILVSILILLYLVNEKFQIQATEPLAETQSFPCRDVPELIVSPAPPKQFWKLNQTNFEIRLNIFPQDCIYRYVVTSIALALPDLQSEVNLDEYSIKYRLDNTNRLVQLRELATSITPVNMGNGMIVEISPLMLEELSIIRLPTNTCARVFRVRYEIRGFTTRRAAELSYLIAQPNCRDDDTYTGKSNGEACYGGRGQPMDTGNPEGDGGSQMTVGWRCNETTINCSYPLRILLTGQVSVSHIMIYGLDTNSNTRAVPEIIIIQPNIRTDSISNEYHHPDSYPIEIPINRKTDEIFIYMVLPAIRILSISKVEVFSNGDCLALFQIDIGSFETTTSTSTTTTSTSEDSKFKDSTITLGPILGAMVAVIIVLTILSIYLSIKYRKVKRLLIKQLSYNTVLKNLNGIPLQPTDQEHSRYLRKLPNPNEIYTIIGPKCPTRNPMDSFNNENHDKIIRTNEIRTNPFIETFSENPSGNSYLTETIETTLQTPIESCDSNCQDTDRTPNKELNLEQERRIPGLERDELQNEVCEMRDNPLYSEVEIAHSNDDFSGYDALKH